MNGSDDSNHNHHNEKDADKQQKKKTDRTNSMGSSEDANASAAEAEAGRHEERGQEEDESQAAPTQDEIDAAIQRQATLGGGVSRSARGTDTDAVEAVQKPARDVDRDDASAKQQAARGGGNESAAVNLQQQEEDDAAMKRQSQGGGGADANRQAEEDAAIKRQSQEGGDAENNNNDAGIPKRTPRAKVSQSTKDDMLKKQAAMGMDPDLDPDQAEALQQQEAIFSSVRQSTLSLLPVAPSAAAAALGVGDVEPQDIFSERAAIDGLQALPGTADAADAGGAHPIRPRNSAPGAFHQVGRTQIIPAPPPTRPSAAPSAAAASVASTGVDESEKSEASESSRRRQHPRHAPQPPPEASITIGNSTSLPIAAALAEDLEQLTREKLEAEIREELSRDYIRRSQLTTGSEANIAAAVLAGLPQQHAHHGTRSSSPPVLEGVILRDASSRSQGTRIPRAQEQPASNHNNNSHKRNNNNNNAAEHDKGNADSEEDGYYGWKKSATMIAVIVVAVVILGVILGVALSSKNKKGSDTKPDLTLPPGYNFPTRKPTIAATAPPTAPPTINLGSLPVLQAIQERGHLVCRPEAGERSRGYGFTLDLCRVIAAAVLGDGSLVKFPSEELSSWGRHFLAVHDGLIDVSTAQVSHNMGRNVREPNSLKGFTFSTPYLYTGTGLAGVPEFVECAKVAETFAGNCRNLKVCVHPDTVTQRIIEEHLSAGSNTVVVTSAGESSLEGFVAGKCNVLAGDTIGIHEQFARDLGYTGEYLVSDKLFSHEQLALMTRQNDPEWAQLCNWLIRSLIAAEAMNITSTTSQKFWETNLFGSGQEDYSHMFERAIAEVGNYAELYDRHYATIWPRVGNNNLNMGNTGLMIAAPFGELLLESNVEDTETLPKPIPGGTMEHVADAAALVCGVMLQDKDGRPRLGFAEYNATSDVWSGMDVDYCRGLAATVSAGSMIETILVSMSDDAIRYQSLQNGTVDVIAGERVSMTQDILEPTTKRGFTFAPPYFYNEEDGSAIALMTRQDDPQWSLLAKWMTQAMMYAEGQGITQATASQMPIVELFGSQYLHMFRDAAQAVGSYGEIYERNLQSVIERGGRNLLNSGNDAQLWPVVNPF